MLTVVVPAKSEEPPLLPIPGAAGAGMSGRTRQRGCRDLAPGTQMELGKSIAMGGRGLKVVSAELGVGVGK